MNNKKKKAKKAAKPKETFLVTWGEPDSDPVSVFKTLEAAKEHAKYLIESEGEDAEYIRIYRVVEAMKIKQRELEFVPV